MENSSTPSDNRALSPDSPASCIQPAQVTCFFPKQDLNHITRKERRTAAIWRAKQNQLSQQIPKNDNSRVQKKPGFDVNRVADIRYPFNQYATWDEERRCKLFSRIICIPHAHLTREICRKATVLAELLNKKLSAKFLARQEELENQKKERIQRRLEKKAEQMAEQQKKQLLDLDQKIIDKTMGYQDPSSNGQLSLICPELFIEPLEDFSGSQDNHLEGNEALQSIRPPICDTSPGPSNHPSQSCPEKISKKINSLYNNFCTSTIRDASAGINKNNIATMEGENSQEREIIRVLSPVNIETNFWDDKGHQKDVFPVEYPPEEIAKTEKYTLEEPLVTLTQVIRTPITVQELEKVSDMVLLCQLRDSPSILKPFVHYTTLPFLRKLSKKLGQGFRLQVITKTANVYIPSSKSFKPAPRITTQCWFSGITKILTLGEGTYSNAQGAAELAHASCLAALVYMMVIPYQIVVAVQKSGENYIPLAIHACKKRIRELIVVSRDPYFDPLLLHEGNLNEINETTKEIWANFINRMRHMGMTFWEDNKIKIPEYWHFFPRILLPEFYFESVLDKEPFTWDGMIPDFYDNVPFDIEDFVATGSFARFSLSPAESGLAKDIPYVNTNRAVLYQLKHTIPNIPFPKFDPIVHLPFKDLLFRYGAVVLNPMLTLFAIKYIGRRWGKRVLIKHQLIVDVEGENKETWKHIVTLTFQGIPYFFLGARCAKENFSSCITHCCSIIAQQLSSMMIIPKEICELLESRSRTILAAVIYGCKLRFKAFESLIGNPMFAPLITLEIADLQFDNPLYKLAEHFYWRMRNTGRAYWMENRRIIVPTELINIKISKLNRLLNVAFQDLPKTTFFQFQESSEEADWTQINCPKDTYDNFDVNCLVPEDRFPAHWECCRWSENSKRESFTPNYQPMEITNEHPIPPQSHEFREPDYDDFENALINEFRLPLCLLTSSECESVLNIVRSLATMNKTFLQFNTENEHLPNGHTRFHCAISWAGDLGWLLNAQYSDEQEDLLRYGTAWILYKLLARMGIVPPGLYKFICNNTSRLPYIVSSLAPFFCLLEFILSTNRNLRDCENRRTYVIDKMHQLGIEEWLKKTIFLPPDLLPNLQETEQFPFIKTGVIDFKECEEWSRKSNTYPEKVDVLNSKSGIKNPSQKPRVKMSKKKFDNNLKQRRTMLATQSFMNGSKRNVKTQLGPSSFRYQLNSGSRPNQHGYKNSHRIYRY